MKFTKAQIVITDKNGKILKQINIAGNRKTIVNIDAGTLYRVHVVYIAS